MVIKMVSIYDLLREEKEKIEEIKKLRIDLVEEERLRNLDEANAWNMDFKSIGATTDKLRTAAVKRKLNAFPNTYAQKKAEYLNLELDLKFLRQAIEVMAELGEENIELEKDKDKESSVTAS